MRAFLIDRGLGLVVASALLALASACGSGSPPKASGLPTRTANTSVAAPASVTTAGSGAAVASTVSTAAPNASASAAPTAAPTAEAPSYSEPAEWGQRRPPGPDWVVVDHEFPLEAKPVGDYFAYVHTYSSRGVLLVGRKPSDPDQPVILGEVGRPGECNGLPDPEVAALGKEVVVRCYEYPPPGTPDPDLSTPYSVHSDLLRFHTSSDGGGSWHRDETPLRIQARVFERDVRFWPIPAGLIVNGACVDPQKSPCDGHAIIRTGTGPFTDVLAGGKTVELVAVAYGQASRTIYAVGTISHKQMQDAHGNVGGWCPPGVYISRNGGTSFVRRDLPLGCDRQPVPDTLTGDLTARLALDSRGRLRTVAIQHRTIGETNEGRPGHSYLFTTNDDGRSFRYAPLPRDNGAVTFVGQRGVTWAREQGALQQWETRDGGRSWFEMVDGPYDAMMLCGTGGCLFGRSTIRVGWPAKLGSRWVAPASAKKLKPRHPCQP